MALSYITYVGDGTTTDYAFGSVPMLNAGAVPYANQLVVYVNGTEVVSSTYTVNTPSETISFVTPPANGETIRIQRVTKSDDRYVDWPNSTNLSQEQLRRSA